MTILGINDELFIRGNIPMTKQEVRILLLAKAQIQPDNIIIDIGAGTGSISIEAARQAPKGRVYAIEQQQEGLDLILANAEKFNTPNITAIAGTAPQALENLPPADIIIIGGSGGDLKDILFKCDNLLKPGGRLLITAVTVETLCNSLTLMNEKTDYTVSASGLQVTRIRQVGRSNMFDALNQIYIITCIKGGHNDTAR